jgi:aminoglycoside phosphotransferase (APT) family kinase protein
MEQLDISTLGLYLEQQVGGFADLQSAKKFSGGQSNPTYLLNAASGKYVLRRQPPGKLLKSAHAVDREYHVIAALQDTDVPVPRAYHLCEDRSVIGSMFFLMSFEEGRIFWNPELPEMSAGERTDCYADLIRVLAAMHNVDVSVVGLEDFGKPGNYFERQIGRWSSQYRAAETHRIDEMEKLMAWLAANTPQDDGQVSLIHGDYRLDNVMMHASEPRAIAVLDWELSTLGHPLADLAYYCMCLRLPPAGRVQGLAGVDRTALGIPGEQEIVDRYCSLRGIEGIGLWNFYLAFSFFRLAAIVQGVYKRALDGNASSDRAMEVGRMAGPLARMGAELTD